MMGLRYMQKVQGNMQNVLLENINGISYFIHYKWLSDLKKALTQNCTGFNEEYQ